MAPRLEVARIIARAVASDLEGTGTEGVGAIRDKVEALGALLDARVKRQRQKVAFLDQGSPTTVDVASIEKVAEVVQRTGRFVNTASATFKTARVKLGAASC